MQSCSTCHKENPPTANFCNTCGAKLASGTVVLTQAKDRSTLVGWLVPVDAPHVSIKLMGSENDLGKSAKCDIDFSAHLDPASPALATVSREHAKILLDQERVSLIDLNSTNATFINGQKVAAYERTELGDHSRIAFGKLEFRFKRFKI